jgi:dTDP-4-dehydrorhamnose reductase
VTNRQKILITGGSGQVGAKICKVLSPYFDVLGLSRNDLDVGSYSSLKKVFKSFEPNIVINAAAYTKVDEAEKNQNLSIAVNYLAVKSLSELCAANSSFLIHFSTDYVFDGSMEHPCSENDQTNPLNVYGQTKLAGDNHIIKHAQKYAIFRLAWVYDNHGMNFPKKILNAAKINSHIKVVNDQFGTPTSADFISEAVFKFIANIDLMGSDNGKWLLNLVPNGCASWFEFAAYLLAGAEKAGIELKCKSKDLIPVSTSQINQLAPRPSKVILANDKIQGLIGTEFADWRVGADKFIQQMNRC